MRITLTTAFAAVTTPAVRGTAMSGSRLRTLRLGSPRSARRGTLSAR
ncbi:hypothetical protein [Serinibacter salmoneus]|uniref:Uncharacterized protein n=1 Tax=Serinibacter salmoneus TaxID=556530 RepID=A0A2A9CYC2_9MICO|nr:hypothetical protein [Serinibacter salmoneus]PFG19136.1 hypothetical protein ATL40_0692 [Serinibacter salmoneus]